MKGSRAKVAAGFSLIFPLILNHRLTFGVVVF
jgi:hypothetical protein